MKTFQITLEGYNYETSETDDLIKWINAPNEATLIDFLLDSNMKYVQIEDMRRVLTKEEGVDYIL